MQMVNSFFVIDNIIGAALLEKQDRFYFFYDTMAEFFDNVVYR